MACDTQQEKVAYNTQQGATLQENLTARARECAASMLLCLAAGEPGGGGAGNRYQ